VGNHDHAIYMCGGSGASTGLEDGCRSFVIANNLLFDGPDGYVIQLGQSARNGFIVNNTIDNSTAGSTPACAVILWGTGTWKDANDLFTNNIITNVAGSASNAICTSGGNLVGNLVRNNLAYGVNGTAYEPVWGSYVGFTVGTNLPNADPLYVDRSGTYGVLSTKDFHLQAGSPALGKGDSAYTPPTDAYGTPRAVYPNAVSGVSAPALGAFG
jgi:hypothetical protein